MGRRDRRGLYARADARALRPGVGLPVIHWLLRHTLCRWFGHVPSVFQVGFVRCARCAQIAPWHWALGADGQRLEIDWPA